MRTLPLCFAVLMALGSLGLCQTSVSNIATLKAITTPSNGQVVDVGGYYSASDGGGGRFVWESGSTVEEDHGLVIDDANAGGNGRWIRQVPNGSLNVKMFGAQSGQNVGDAIAIENNDRIQKALDAAANGGHEVLHFLGGYYELGRPVLTNVNNAGSAFATSSKIFAHVDQETGGVCFYYLRMGGHENSVRPRIRLAGEGATLHGVTSVTAGSTVLLIRTKFTSVEIDGLTFRTTTDPTTNNGRFHGITILPMQVPIAPPGVGNFWADYYSTADAPPTAETQTLRDAPTESIAIKNSKFIGCRTAIITPVIPRRDLLTFAGNLQTLEVQTCEFMYPNGADESDANDSTPATAMTFNEWVGTLKVADCLFDGATTGDATPQGPGGNNRGPVDNFIWGGGIRNVVERNVVKHAGVEGIMFPIFQDFPISSTVNGSSTIPVAADKSLEVRAPIMLGMFGNPPTWPPDLSPSVRDNLVGIRVCLTGINHDNSSSVDHGVYEISEILQDAQLYWTRIKLVSTGDPKNALAGSSINLQYTYPDQNVGLYLAPSERRIRGIERTVVASENFFGGDPVSNSASSAWWYCYQGIRADDHRVTIVGNTFDNCISGVHLNGHSFADEAVSGSLIDRNRFNLVDYAGDIHLPQTSDKIAVGAFVMAPGVTVSNNTIKSVTNKRVHAISALYNCGDISVFGNTITAGQKLSSLPESEKGHAIGLFNIYFVFGNSYALTAEHPAYVANNTIKNLDYEIRTVNDPVVIGLSLSAGRPSAPSLNFGGNGDPMTGIFSDAIGSVGISLDGTLVAKFVQGTYTPSGGGSPVEYNALHMTSGTDDRPGYGFDGDDDTGMYRKGEDQIGFATGGLERMLIGSTGVVIDDGLQVNGAGVQISGALSGLTVAGAGSPIGAPTPAIKRILSKTESINFPSVNPDTFAQVNVTVTGAAIGDTVLLGLPASIPGAISFMAHVTAADTVTVRARNVAGGGGAQDPALADYRITVIQF